LEASYEAFFLPDINNVMDVNIINLFEFPIYHVRNFAPEYRETCASNITNQYKERACYVDNNPIKGEYWRRISLYDDKGVHAHTKGLDGIQGIPEWTIVKKQIKEHAIDYLQHFKIGQTILGGLVMQKMMTILGITMLICFLLHVGLYNTMRNMHH